MFAIDTRRKTDPKIKTVEWPTLLLAMGVYAAWGLVVFWLSAHSLGLAIVLTAVIVALHASLTHEAIHGHPFRSEALNEALVFPALGILYPYRRFRDTHRLHHQEPELTDPYDDPETNYLARRDWEGLPKATRALLGVNNTLFGRLLIGPAIGAVLFVIFDRRQALLDPSIRTSWLMWLPAVAVVVALVWVSPMPLWAYLAAAYMGQSIVRIRTYLEHQAHENPEGRTVIIDDRGVLGFLFLNNNLHAVHHAHPGIPWYNLRAAFLAERAQFLDRNEGYFFTSYGAIFRRYLFRAKDPVAHPLRRVKD